MVVGGDAGSAGWEEARTLLAQPRCSRGLFPPTTTFPHRCHTPSQLVSSPWREGSPGRLSGQGRRASDGRGCARVCLSRRGADSRPPFQVRPAEASGARPDPERPSKRPSTSANPPPEESQRRSGLCGAGQRYQGRYAGPRRPAEVPSERHSPVPTGSSRVAAGGRGSAPTHPAGSLAGGSAIWRGCCVANRLLTMSEISQAGW